MQANYETQFYKKITSRKKGLRISTIHGLHNYNTFEREEKIAAIKLEERFSDFLGTYARRCCGISSSDRLASVKHILRGTDRPAAERCDFLIGYSGRASTLHLFSRARASGSMNRAPAVRRCPLLVCRLLAERQQLVRFHIKTAFTQLALHNADSRRFRSLTNPRRSQNDFLRLKTDHRARK